ncbi:MAG: ABC transporter ATP-binding protein [Clostridia bacterium]|nr:ABC transporter ATP-binding protein [Clostridia bacterium]
MIKLNSLSVAYNRRSVINNLSCEINKGELTVIIGPNGSGKSTLMKSALGLLPISSGEIVIDDKNLSDYSIRDRAKKMAYHSQNRVVPDISVERFVLHGRFPYLNYPRRYTKEDKEIVAKCLKEVGADDFRHKNITELSGGERQRVYIAMALAQDTDYLFMDEPLTYLDIRYQLEVMELSKQLVGKGKSIIAVLHDIPLAMKYADKNILMHEGEIRFTGSAEDLYKSGEVDKCFGVRLLNTNGIYHCEPR